MSSYIDHKITIWERIYIDDNQVNAIKNLLIGGKNINDLFNEDIVDNNHFLLETEQSITVEENNNQATLQLFYDNNIIYDNKDGECLNG